MNLNASPQTSFIVAAFAHKRVSQGQPRPLHISGIYAISNSQKTTSNVCSRLNEASTSDSVSVLSLQLCAPRSCDALEHVPLPNLM